MTLIAAAVSRPAERIFVITVLLALPFGVLFFVLRPGQPSGPSEDMVEVQRLLRALAPPCERTYFGECVDNVPRAQPPFESPWARAEDCMGADVLNEPYRFRDPACPYRQGDGVSAACMYYCFYSQKWGVARISPSLWEAAQRGEAAIWRTQAGSDDRNAENAEGFEQYAAVPSRLGRILEIGSGPYTQTKTMLDLLERARGADLSVEDVTLVDPGIDSYLKNTVGCTYRNGRLDNRWPVAGTHAMGGEDIVFDAEFDTVVSVNVIEHAQNGFEYMRRMHNALRPGGVLVLHERHYTNFWQTFHPVTNANEVAGLHPLRVTRKFVMQMFEESGEYDWPPLFFSERLTGAMEQRKRTQIAETPLWIIARKKATAV